MYSFLELILMLIRILPTSAGELKSFCQRAAVARLSGLRSGLAAVPVVPRAVLRVPRLQRVPRRFRGGSCRRFSWLLLRFPETCFWLLLVAFTSWVAAFAAGLAAAAAVFVVPFDAVVAVAFAAVFCCVVVLHLLRFSVFVAIAVAVAATAAFAAPFAVDFVALFAAVAAAVAPAVVFAAVFASVVC